MDRRTFLKSGAIATSGIGSVGIAASAQAIEQTSPSVYLKTALSPRFHQGYLRDRADRFAQRLKDLSDGRIILDFTTAQSTSSGLTRVCDGSVTAYFGTEADHLGENKGLAYFSGLSGGLSLAPEQFAIWLSAGAGQLHWDAIASKSNVKSFAVGHSGRRTGVWLGRDIERLSELSGLNAEISGVAGYVAERLGLKLNTSIDTADIIEPLVGVTAWIAENYPIKNRIWFRNGFYCDGVILSFGLAREVWENITVTDQAIFEACANEAYYQSLAEHEAHDVAVAPHLFKAHGVQQRTMPADINKAILHVTIELLHEWLASDAALAHVHKSYMQFRQNTTGLADPLTTQSFIS